MYSTIIRFYQVGRPDPGDTDPDRVEARTRLQAQLSGERLAEVLEQLARCPAGLDATLAKVIRMGVSGVKGQQISRKLEGVRLSLKMKTEL